VRVEIHLEVAGVSAERGNVPAVVETATPVTTSTMRSSLVVPAMIADAGDRVSRRFLDFLAASIENDNTRMAYYRAVCSFFGRRASGRRRLSVSHTKVTGAQRKVPLTGLVGAILGHWMLAA
jgi:hypothetical protein